jgi:hypothetical protein
VAQWPNLALSAFLVVEVVRLLWQPAGRAGSVFEVLSATALLAWAVDEIVRGVNPFRRLLGLAVLGLTLASLFGR